MCFTITEVMLCGFPGKGALCGQCPVNQLCRNIMPVKVNETFLKILHLLHGCNHKVDNDTHQRQKEHRDEGEKHNGQEEAEQHSHQKPPQWSSNNLCRVILWVTWLTDCDGQCGVCFQHVTPLWEVVTFYSLAEIELLTIVDNLMNFSTKHADLSCHCYFTNNSSR